MLSLLLISILRYSPNLSNNFYFCKILSAKEKIKKPEISLDLIEYNLCRLFDKKDFDNILNLFIKTISIYNDKIDITFTGIESSVSVRLDSKWQE